MNAGKNQRLIQGICRLFWEPPDPRHNLYFGPKIEIEYIDASVC